MTQGISAVLITLNEEKNIANAILSVKPWVQEVIVVDMMSDDGTVEIARSLGARLYEHPRVGFVEPARAAAVSYAAGPWVLILDADEMIPLSLSNELVRIAASDSVDVCRLPRLNYVLGKPMLNGLHGPERDSQVRFFKKGSLAFSNQIHSYPTPVPGVRLHQVRYAPHGAIRHFHAANAFQLIEKLNRYTDTEAEQRTAASRRGATWRVVALPPIVILRSYIVAGGWKDGWRGFFWAWLMGFYQLAKEAKHLQLTEQLSNPRHDIPYSDEVRQIALEYETDSNSPKDSALSRVDTL
jgi:glycosyltransferase involved in cell wall biosynthesis